jgi:hypothetical protein
MSETKGSLHVLKNGRSKQSRNVDVLKKTTKPIRITSLSAEIGGDAFRIQVLTVFKVELNCMCLTQTVQLKVKNLSEIMEE